MSVHEGPSRISFWGLFFVPALLYPWFLLIFAQLLFQGVSLLGHLSGLLSGYVAVYAFMNRTYWKKIIGAIERRLPSRFTSIASFLYWPETQRMAQGGGGGSALQTGTFAAMMRGFASSISDRMRSITGNRLPFSSGSAGGGEATSAAASLRSAWSGAGRRLGTATNANTELPIHAPPAASSQIHNYGIAVPSTVSQAPQQYVADSVSGYDDRSRGETIVDLPLDEQVAGKDASLGNDEDEDDSDSRRLL